MFEIRIYAPICQPWNTFDVTVASNITGNQLRALLRRKIDGDGVLNVSYFRPYCESFLREFIEPCLDAKGYPQNGEYTTHSNNLCMDVKYRIEAVPFSTAALEANDKFKPNFMRFGRGRYIKDIVNELINYL